MNAFRLRLVVSGCLALVASVPGRSAAQDAPLAVELLAGATIPVASFASGKAVGEGTGAGASFGLLFTRAGQGRRTTYFGFSQHRFPCQDAGCPADGRYVATGLNAGFRFTLLRKGIVWPWVGLGALTTRVESPGIPASPTGVSKLGFGGEAGFGLYIGAGRSVALNPAVRFANVGVRLPGDEPLTMRYLVGSLAVVLAF